MRSRKFFCFQTSFFLLFLFFSGCISQVGNTGQVQSFPFMGIEAKWIRNGEPIEYEGEQWYPVDGIENLLDSEVFMLGEYRNIQFFVEKADVRPYNRLYTKFGKNQFRYFTKKKNDNKSL